MKLEPLDVTLILKPVEGLVSAYSLKLGRKFMVKEGSPFLEPGDAEFVCDVASKYSSFIRSKMKLEDPSLGWCADFEARRLAGIKGNYAVVVECFDVTGDERAAEELAKAFGPLSGEVLTSWSSFLCRAFAVWRAELEELMEDWEALSPVKLVPY